MKKILCVLLATLMLTAVPVTAYAGTQAITASLGLDFEGSTAYCSAMINANDDDDVVRAVVRLWYEGERIKIWYISGNLYAGLDRTVDISDYGNGTYELTVDFTVNDVAYEQASFERVYQNYQGG